MKVENNNKDTQCYTLLKMLCYDSNFLPIFRSKRSKNRWENATTTFNKATYYSIMVYTQYQLPQIHTFIYSPLSALTILSLADMWLPLSIRCAVDEEAALLCRDPLSLGALPLCLRPPLSSLCIVITMWYILVVCIVWCEPVVLLHVLSQPFSISEYILEHPSVPDQYIAVLETSNLQQCNVSK